MKINYKTQHEIIQKIHEKAEDLEGFKEIEFEYENYSVWAYVDCGEIEVEPGDYDTETVIKKEIEIIELDIDEIL